MEQVPYMIVVGEKEAEEGNIAVRDRSNETHPFETADFIAKVCEEMHPRSTRHSGSAVCPGMSSQPRKVCGAVQVYGAEAVSRTKGEGMPGRFQIA